MTQKKFVTSEIGQEEVQVEMTMPRATVHLEVRVITGTNKEPLKDATVTLRCRNPLSTTVGNQGSISLQCRH